jgi:signal transduction histidine kinase
MARQIGASIERQYVRQIGVRAEREATTDLGATLGALDMQATIFRVVAHDVRTPLSWITHSVDLCKRGLVGPLTPEQESVLDNVQYASVFVNRLMNDVLDVISIEQQTFALMTIKFDAANVVRIVADACRPLADQRGLQLLVEVKTALPMIGDADRVQQILFNLLNNAIRYTQRGWVRISALAHADGVRFRVDDSGPGIAPEVLPSIWTRNTRATTVGTGFGLGLYVVRQLVLAMDGEVGVESEVGRGSCFWVQLPTVGPRPQQVPWAND